jgi:hypothetical protein
VLLPSPLAGEGLGVRGRLALDEVRAHEPAETSHPQFKLPQVKVFTTPRCVLNSFSEFVCIQFATPRLVGRDRFRSYYGRFVCRPLFFHVVFSKRR